MRYFTFFSPFFLFFLCFSAIHYVTYSLVAWCSCWNQLEYVQAVLNCQTQENRVKLVNMQCKTRFSYVGIPKRCTPLIGAMTLGTWDVVNCLLEYGANPYLETENKNTAFMCACMKGRFDNCQSWIEHFQQNFDINKKNRLGGTALGFVFFYALCTHIHPPKNIHKTLIQGCNLFWL